MKPILEIVTEELLTDLGTRSNLRYGQKLYERGDVQLQDGNVFNVRAQVKHGNGEARKVELSSTPKGFRYKCSCTARKNYFCEHCVAVGLAAIADRKL